MFYRRELRRGCQIVIPEVMVNRLEVPEVFARPRIQSEKRIGVEIIARAVSAVKFVLCRCERKIDDTALYINCDLAPYIDAAHVFVRVRRPRIVSGFAGARNRMKDPDKFAGADVECANISGRCEIPFAGKATDDDQVFKDTARCSGG